MTQLPAFRIKRPLTLAVQHLFPIFHWQQRLTQQTMIQTGPHGVAVTYQVIDPVLLQALCV